MTNEAIRSMKGPERKTKVSSEYFCQERSHPFSCQHHLYIHVVMGIYFSSFWYCWSQNILHSFRVEKDVLFLWKQGL